MWAGMWAWLVPPCLLSGVQYACLETSVGNIVPSGIPSIHSRCAHPSVPQGVQGADFECEGSVVPGKCAFGGPVSELLATVACTQTYAQQCRSSVVYTKGLDGCGSKLVLLKSADPVPSNSFAAPTVFTMERAEGAMVGAGRGAVICGSVPRLPLKESRDLCRAPNVCELPCLGASRLLLCFTTYTLMLLLAAAALQTGGFIFRSEASFLGSISDSDGPPAACNSSSSASTAAGGAAPNTTASAGASGGNGTAACEPAWLGCMVSNVPALMAGDVVATLDSVPSAEACCRECRKRSPAANVFNYCGRLEGCRWASLCRCCHLATAPLHLYMLASSGLTAACFQTCAGAGCHLSQPQNLPPQPPRPALLSCPADSTTSASRSRLRRGSVGSSVLLYTTCRAFASAALPTTTLPMVACRPPPLHPAVHSPSRPSTNKPHPTPLHRHAGQLRYQSTVDPSTSTPPVLLAKGDEAGGFTAGTPLAAYAPETANFTRFVGAGLFGQPGTPCPNSSM